jgi:hypothetical protein
VDLAGPQHAAECSEDDTCDCESKPTHDKVDAALNLCQQEGFHLASLLASHDDRVARLEAVATMAQFFVDRCYLCNGTGTLTAEYDFDDEKPACVCTQLRLALAALVPPTAPGRIGPEAVRAMLADPTLSPREIHERVIQAHAPLCLDCGKRLLTVAVCVQCPVRVVPGQIPEGRCSDCYRKHDVLAHGGVSA